MFAVVVFKASMLNWWGGPSVFGIYMCIGLSIYRSAIALDLAVKRIWCSGMQGIYAQLTGVSIGPIYLFGVAVFKASMLD